MRTFADEHAGAYEGVVVSEPTGCRPVLEHRGIVSCQVEFRGQGGHASLGVAPVDDALRDGPLAWPAVEDTPLREHLAESCYRKDDPEGLIRQGNEWVIGARLADAGFFFAEDRKKKLEDLVPDLARLEFHRVLGSIGAKADRTAAVAVALREPSPKRSR